VNFSTFLVEVSYILLIYHFAKEIHIVSNCLKGSNKKEHAIIPHCIIYKEVILLHHQNKVLYYLHIAIAVF